MRKSLFCFGLGYSAMVLAARLIARGWRVAGTARDGERIDELKALGIEAYAFSTAGGAAAIGRGVVKKAIKPVVRSIAKRLIGVSWTRSRR